MQTDATREPSVFCPAVLARRASAGVAVQARTPVVQEQHEISMIDDAILVVVAECVRRNVLPPVIEQDDEVVRGDRVVIRQITQALACIHDHIAIRIKRLIVDHLLLVDLAVEIAIFVPLHDEPHRSDLDALGLRSCASEIWRNIFPRARAAEHAILIAEVQHR